MNNEQQESIAYCTARNQSPCKITNKIVHHTSVPLYEGNASIGQILFDILDRKPKRIGQIDAITDERMTFAQIKERSIRCALWLESRDIQLYDTVAVLMCNYLDCMTATLGSLFIGACVFPMHEQMDLYECRYFLTFMKPKAVFVNIQFAKIMSQAAKMEGISVAVIVFDRDLDFELNDLEFYCISQIINKQNSDNVTRFRCSQIPHIVFPAVYVLSRSSTWLTKTAMISHFALLNNIKNDSTFPKNFREHNIVMWLNVFPQIVDIRMLLQSIYFCKTLIIFRDNCVEKACKMVKKYKVKWLWMRSFNAMYILKKKCFSKYRSLSLKTIVIDDVGMRIPLRQNLKEILPDTEIMFVYSMVELGGVGAIHTNNNKISSIGFGFCCSKLKVVDETVVGTEKLLGPNEVGNLVWKSPYLMNGYYYNNSIASNEVIRRGLDKDGWFHSDDRGYYDEDGEIYILERKKAIQVDGGFVYLSEIENMLRLQFCRIIREVAVVLENKDSNNILFVFVSTDNSSDIIKNRLINRVRQILMEEEHRSSFFIHVVFLRQLPRTRTLKIDKKEFGETMASIVKDAKEKFEKEVSIVDEKNK